MEVSKTWLKVPDFRLLVIAEKWDHKHGSLATGHSQHCTSDSLLEYCLIVYSEYSLAKACLPLKCRTFLGVEKRSVWHRVCSNWIQISDHKKSFNPFQNVEHGRTFPIPLDEIASLVNWPYYGTVPCTRYIRGTIPRYTTGSRSTRRDQGCVLVRRNPGSVKREEFVVLVV